MTTSNDNQLCMQLTNDEDEGDSDDDDAFTFQKRSFAKRCLSALDSPVKTKSRKRQQSSVGRDQQRAALNHKSRETIKKVLKMAADSDTDTDDSDVVPGSTRKTPVAAAAPAPVAPAINILDDSSDDDDFLMSKPAQTSVYSMERNGVVRQETCQALLKARTAKLELEKAQRYHAEDVYVPVGGPSQYSALYRQGGATFSSSGLSSASAGDTRFSSQSPAVQPSRPPVGNASANLGPTLKISLRSVNVVDGKKSPPTTDMQTIRKNEPFEALLARFLAAKNLNPSSTQVVMKFDGETIAMSKTPASYDMDDEDMVDCEIRATAPVASAAVPQTIPPPAKAANLGPNLKISLRSVNIVDGKRSSPTTDKQTIRKNELFEALLARYLAAKNLNPSSTQVVMKFDGQTIAMNKTPASYDMEDEDMVDCEIRATAPVAPAALTQAIPTPVESRTCRLKLVTKKARRPTVKVVTVNFLNQVQALVDQYKVDHKLAAKAKVSLQFDGQLMQVSRTLESYGLDDDDQIDVTVK